MSHPLRVIRAGWPDMRHQGRRRCRRP